MKTLYFAAVLSLTCLLGFGGSAYAAHNNAHSVEISDAVKIGGTKLKPGTDNKSGSNAARSELWRAVRGSATERGHHLHAHRVTALSLVDIVEFYTDHAFVCDPEPHRSSSQVQRWSV